MASHHDESLDSNNGESLENETLNASHRHHQSINVDRILQHIVKPFGLWQWLIVLLLVCTTPSPSTFPVFANSVSSHRCKMESRVEEFAIMHNLSFNQMARQTAPTVSNKSESGENSKSIGCIRYALDWETVDLTRVLLTNSTVQTTSTELCPLGFIFERSENHYPGNVVAEFETVCHLTWLVPSGTSLYMLGMLIGFFSGGWSGDFFGRRKTLWVFGCLEFGASIGVSLSKNYWSYVICRLLIGVGNTVKMSVGNVLVLEITIARYRSILSAVLALGLDFIFRALMSLWAYLLPDWRVLNMVYMCTSSLSILYIVLLPESPRWLISCGKFDEAWLQLRRGYRINHLCTKNRDGERKMEALRPKPMTPDEGLKGSNQRFCANICAPFASKRSLIITLLSSMVAFGIAMSFIGIMLYARIISGSVYLLAFISSLTGIPSTVLSAILYRVFQNRKYPLIVIISLASIVLGLSGINNFVQLGFTDLILTICANMGLVLTITSICMIYVYIPELFPSEIRTLGFGIVFGLSRLGTILCPYINETDRHVFHGFPMIIYAVAMLGVAILVCFLPNTAGDNLPDRVTAVGDSVEISKNSSEQTGYEELESEINTEKGAT